jgi:cysteine-rich repeat protein
MHIPKKLLNLIWVLPILFIFGMPKAYAADISADFTDANFQTCVCTELDTCPGIDSADAAALITLHCNSKDIASLAGAEHLLGLGILYLYDNDITSVTPLSTLTNLGVLELGNNNISSASPLSTLINLWMLSLGNNNVTDLTPLSTLTSLRMLGLWGNGISDLDGLEGLSDLEQVDLRENDITELDSIDWSTLTSLEDLSFNDWNMGDSYDNEVTDLSPLDSAPALTTLTLWRNKADITTIPNLIKRLESLDLFGNDITDLSFLSNADAIQTLDIRANTFANSELSVISGLTTLEYIMMGSNGNIDDLSAIDWADLTNLTGIYIIGTNITTAEHLSDLVNPGNLTKLDLSYNSSLTNISSVSEFENLTYLNLMFSTAITDISALADLTDLTTTDLRWTDSSLHDLSPLNDGLNGPGSDCDAATEDCSCTNCFADNNNIDFSNSTGLNGGYAPAALQQIAILRDTPSATVTENIDDDITAEFTDLNFRSCVETALGAGSIGAVDAAALTTLDCDSDSIASIAGAQYLTGLTDLELNHNSITDLTPLGALSDLTTLGLSDNNISDLSPIGSGNANVLGFASGNTIDITDNLGLNDANAAAAFVEIAILEGDGATVLENIIVCGDSVTEGTEECDDGNLIDGDGCSAVCVTEYCGDTIVNNVDEQCDDGNLIDEDR